METIKSHSFKDMGRDMGVMLGRPMRHILRSRDAMITVTIIIMPIAFMLLLVYALSSTIQTLEDIFLVILNNKMKNKWKR